LGVRKRGACQAGDSLGIFTRLGRAREYPAIRKMGDHGQGKDLGNL